MHTFDRNCYILYSFIYIPPEDGLFEAETCTTVIKKYGECCSEFDPMERQGSSIQEVAR